MYTREELIADIPLELAIRAHSGTSFSPEQRGESERTGYADQLIADYAAVTQRAKPEQIEEINAAFAIYRQRMKALQLACLYAHTRVMSTMITGGSNFPVRSQQKKGATYDRRMQEWIDYRTKALAHMHKLTVPIEDQPIRTGEAGAVDALQTKISQAETLQALMRTATAAIRKHAKTGPDAQIEALVALGISEKHATELLQPDFCKRIGFPDYALTNNSANIRRMKQQQAKAAALASIPSTEATSDHNGVTVSDNAAADRVQIIFPDKPVASVRAELKRHGFRWSPSNNAWQRFRGAEALRLAHQLASTYTE
ncbi:hypothetical protein BH10CHL1_BH10CHL1_50070 [soil metagenome]